jgi:molecular chaperone HtpG
MVFQDDALKFDIGRKSIHGKTQAIYQAKAKEIFNNFTKYVTKYSTAIPATVIPTSTFDRYAIRQEIEKIADLQTSKVSFAKLPSEQEAAVSAIFFELIGNGTIDDIKPIYLGYRQKYDLYANYTPSTGNPQFKFFEFKSHLRNLTKDFSEARKVFDEMDFVICWDVNDEDVQALSIFGIGCDEISIGTLYTLDCPKSVSHRLTIPNCNPVYVIDLKKLV